MADDRPRPTENDNQDADTGALDAPETDEEPGDAAAAGDGATGTDAVASGDEPVPDADGESEAPARDADGSSADDPEDADGAETAGERAAGDEPADDVPDEVRKYERFKKMDGAEYDRVNEFLRDRTYITAREWAIARLCADFRTETGVEMTKIGENLPELVPFMTDTYTPQAVNQARSSFEEKVKQAGATFLYGAMSGFFTAEELDDTMYEVTEVAKFLLEVEGVDLSVEEELEAEDRISSVMREVQSASEQLRHDELECPHCGHEMEPADD